MLEYEIDYMNHTVTVTGTGRINKEVFARESFNSKVIIFDGIFYVNDFSFMFANLPNLRHIKGYENVYSKNRNVIGIFSDSYLHKSEQDKIIYHMLFQSSYLTYEKRIKEKEDHERNLLIVEYEDKMMKLERDYDTTFSLEEKYGHDDDAMESSQEYWETLYDRVNSDESEKK